MLFGPRFISNDFFNLDFLQSGIMSTATGKHINIVTNATLKSIMAGPTIQRVVATFADQKIAKTITSERIVVRAAAEILDAVEQITAGITTTCRPSLQIDVNGAVRGCISRDISS